MDHHQKNHHLRQKVHAARVKEPLTDPKNELGFKSCPHTSLLTL